MAHKGLGAKLASQFMQIWRSPPQSTSWININRGDGSLCYQCEAELFTLGAVCNLYLQCRNMIKNIVLSFSKHNYRVHLPSFLEKSEVVMRLLLLRPLCLINFGSWQNPTSPLLALWGKKNWLLGYENGKMGKFPKTKVAQQAANEPIWMLKALRHLCLTHFWSWQNPHFWLLAL